MDNRTSGKKFELQKKFLDPGIYFPSDEDFYLIMSYYIHDRFLHDEKHDLLMKVTRKNTHRNLYRIKRAKKPVYCRKIISRLNWMLPLVYQQRAGTMQVLLPVVPFIKTA
jgi:hypothetical protein